MHRPTPFVLAAGLAVGALALSACGSNSLSTEESSSSSSSSGSGSSSSAAVDKALAAQVPESVKSSGTIRIGTDASYAPNEFLAADGQTVEGMDVQLFDAVAAKLGLKTSWQPSKFDSIIPGVLGGKYDIGVSSFTINNDRLKQVNMVSYFNAGTQWAAGAGNPKKVDPQSPCGLTVAVQKGTVQQELDLPTKQKECKASGKPIDVLIYEGQDQVTAAVASGKADAMLADSPVVAYAVKQSGGKVEAVGDVYDSAPYGIVVPKDETKFAQAIADAFTQLQKSGDYTRILDQWGNAAGGITDFTVNP